MLLLAPVMTGSF